jgi:hypothetical protein
MMEQQALPHEPHISPVDGSFCRLAKPVERGRRANQKEEEEEERVFFIYPRLE